VSFTSIAFMREQSYGNGHEMVLDPIHTRGLKKAMESVKF